MDETIQKNILHELTIIKRLLAQNLLKEDSQIKQISKLDSIGFHPKEIAEMLGTTSNTVNVALNRIRKGKKGESKKSNDN